MSESMLREFGTGYAAGCQGAPPPLHVYDLDTAQANWHPLPRPHGMAPHPDSCHQAAVPRHPASLYGDDPTDPGRQTEPRTATAGMIARFNVNIGSRNVAHSGVRR